MDKVTSQSAIFYFSKYLFRLYGLNPIILLDEYDSPIHDAFVKGYWEELVDFRRGFFNSTFKTNLGKFADSIGVFLS